MKQDFMHLDYTIDRHNAIPGIRYVVRKLVEGYRTVDDDDFQISPLSGGITNILHIVSAKSVPSKERELPVVVRINGNNTEAIIDRSKEAVIQSEAFRDGLGPKYYGGFNNGSVYAFLEGRVLELEEMGSKDICPKIANEVGKWHRLTLPLDKTPSLWITLKKWSEIAPRDFKDPEKSKKLKEINVEQYCKEMEDLKVVLSKLDSPVVFCHNDLLFRNVILLKNNAKVAFIDYEYASYNYRGFDLGNHFNEYGGFGPDYSLYPNKETQMLFFKNYLQTFNNGEEITNKELDKLYIEANQFSLASHLFWGFWSLIQSVNSDIEFDFLDYCQARFRQYQATKQEFLSLFV